MMHKTLHSDTALHSFAQLKLAMLLEGVNNHFFQIESQKYFLNSVMGVLSLCIVCSEYSSGR